MHAQMLSCLALSNSSATPWIVAHLAPLSMELFRQEYWSGFPFPSAGDLPDPGSKPASLVSPALAGTFFSTTATWGALPLFAAAAKSLQSCPTLCDPMTAAHQAPPSLGFSRQELWSGLPFPSPMHESEKCK